MIRVTKYYEAKGDGPLKGTFWIEIATWHMEIRDLTEWQKGSNWWVSMPSKQFEVDGQKKYMPYVKLEEEAHNRFLVAVKEALRSYKHQNGMFSL